LTSKDKGSDAFPKVTPTTAHEILSSYRIRANDEVGFIDLTNSDTNVFNWRGYIVHHIDVDRIVQEPVCGFGFVTLPFQDKNTQKRRTDFVVLLTDGRAVRLRPHAHASGRSGRREDIPVIGCLRTWLRPSACAIASRQGKYFAQCSQADKRSDKDAKDFLDKIDREEFGMGSTVHSRRVEATEWAYGLWLGNGNFAALFDTAEPIPVFGVAAVNSWACFVAKTARHEYTFFPHAGGQVCRG